MAIYYEMKVVAEKIGLSPKTIRVWMEEGLVCPQRKGRRVLFAEEDLNRLLLIRRLRDELGINLAGIDVILGLLDRLKALEAEVSRLRRELEAHKHLLPK